MIALLTITAALAAENQTFRLPAATSGEPYQYSIPVVGGMPPLTWTWSGEIPPGLELQEDGALRGLVATPRSAPYHFAVQVTDSSSPPMGYSIDYELEVRAQPLRILPPEATALKIIPPMPVEGLPAQPNPLPPTVRASAPVAPPPTLAATWSSADLHLIVQDIQATSLYRPSEEQLVQTNILLAVENSNGEKVAFKVVEPPSKGVVKDGNEDVLDKDKGLMAPPGRSSAFAIYEPHPGATGEDSFTYVASTDNASSNEGTVTIKIEKEGLKWELVTAGASGLSADEDENDTSVTGKTNPDFLFRLDWQIQKPKRTADKKIKMIDSKTGRLYINPFVDTGNQWNAHVQFRAGVVQRPVTVMNEAMDVADTDTATTSLTYQRAFTTGAELNYNYVNGADYQGAFFELGGLVRFDFDAFIDDDDIMEDQDGGATFIRLTRREDRRGFYRFEAGFRFALKQSNEDRDTFLSSADGKSLDFPKNMVDLLSLEAVFQRNDALKGLIPTAPNDTAHRLALRFFATPKVPNAPPGTFFLIGLEVSRDFQSGPQDLRLFYGLNSSLDRLF